MRISTEIKKRVSCQDACREYGIDVNRAGFTRCLWHNEKTASLKIYPGDRGYHCFGCGASGSVIDLAMKLFDCSVGDACKRLNDDFRLGLMREGNLSNAERIAQNREAWERRRREREIEAQHEALIDEFNAAIKNLRLAQMLLTVTEPTDPDADFDDYFAIAVRETELARYRADIALEKLAEFEKKRFAS